MVRPPSEHVRPPWLLAAVASWGIALFECMRQPLTWNFTGARLCLQRAVYFMFFRG